MSDSQSVREWLTEQITPLLDDSWRILPNQRMPATIDRITVVVKYTAMERLAEAPQTHLRNTVTLTIADPHEDQVKAEDALDDAVLALCTVLDSLPRIGWTGAQKVLVNETYLGWDITLTVISGKES